MDIVLGVSMTPTAVRMALVEGKGADGATLDQDSFDIATGVSAATSDAPEQVVAAILGTRESALEGGHHLTATGVAWTDHAAAARLRQALRAQRIDDVILVSELHAASALAQALGEAVECERTALLFVERDTATLAVVRTVDGSVVKVISRSLRDSDAAAELRAMVASLESGHQPPQALFLVGSGVDIAALKPQIAACTALPVHLPEDGDLALARGAALAAVNTPRYDATTVGLFSAEDTAAGPTQMAAAGYMAPLGYSAVPDEDNDDIVDLLLSPDVDAAPTAERKRFLLVGSALSTVFVVGVVALVISLAVAIRPTVDQRPTPGDTAVVSNGAVPASPEAQPQAPPAAAPETIQAPIPVVQEAPRPVVVAPGYQAPAPPAPAAPAPAPAAPAPPPAAPAPTAPAPVAAPAPAPAPVIAPPIVIPVPIIPPIFQIPARSNPVVPRYPVTTAPTPASTVPTSTTPSSPPNSTTPSSPPTSTTPSSVTPTTQATQTSEAPTTTAYPTTTAPVTTQAPSSGSGSGSSGGDSELGSGVGGSELNSGGSQTIWPPLWSSGADPQA